MRNRVVNRCTVFVVVVLLAVLEVQARDLDLYVAATGDDSNAGTAKEQPARTLARALKMAKEHAPSGDVVVWYLPGDYGAETLEVDWFPGRAQKLILNGESEGKRARFDGKNEPGTWLVVRGKRGEPSNVVIRGFEVRNYRGAIAFYGERFDDLAWSSGNRIEANRFENIGQFRQDVKPSFAAITLVNSRENIITRNTFRNIRNIDKCDGLHAIYLSGGASNNRISENLFDGGCGDTIKARDRSNNNEIRANQFRHQNGKSIFVDSFCDRRKTAECRDKPQECPSWGNEFAGNKVDAASRAAVKAVTRTVGAASIPDCPVVKPNQARILERG